MSDDNGSDDKNPNNEKPTSPPKPSSPWGKPQDTNNNKGNEPVQGPWGQNPFGRPNNSQNNPQNNPWGNNGNNQQSQNLDDLAKRVEDKIRGMFGNGGNGGGMGGGNTPSSYNGNVDGRVFSYIGMGIIALWLASGIYKVDAGEQAIVTRFGQYVRIAGDGLNYRLPSPIEKHTIVNVQKVNTLTVGADGDENATNGLMLTGDENIVNVGFQVFWRVNNASDFVFNVAHGPDNNGNADQTISAVAEAAMREVVGRSQLEKVLTTGRAQVESQTKELIQKTLDQYQSGIVITQVNLRRSEPPSSVVDAFRQVAAASQEAETKVNQATTYLNSVVPQARGEAARFDQLYQEYKLAPEVTRQRIYLETMEKIYERANKVIIDGKAGNGTMMVLPQDLLKPAASKDAQAASPTANNGGNK
jgi:membrane protease subunit HflK